MEIERKYLVTSLPPRLDTYPHRLIEQGYLCREPVVRVRLDGSDYVLTYKSKGFLIREEYNLPLNQEAYEHLRKKIDGRMITKERYRIPYQNNLTIELDIFKGCLSPLILAEVEFQNETSANIFLPPKWFGEEVTFSPKYQNSTLSIDVS